MSPNGSPLSGLLPALRRLDLLLQQATAAAQAAYGSEAGADSFRGLHIGPDEVSRLLAREPGASPLLAGGTTGDTGVSEDQVDESRLAWLAEAFGLSAFDLDVVVITLAPEIDRRYERLYAYLQDHVSRRCPSVELVLNLLCNSAPAKLLRRAHFAPDAPLIRQGIVHLVDDPSEAEPSLLAHDLKLDEQIVDALLGQAGLDRRLAAFCRVVAPAGSVDDLPLAAERRWGLAALVRQAHERRHPLRLYFHGPGDADHCRAAEALAAAAGAPLLVADLARAPSSGADFEQALHIVFREAWFRDAVLYVDHLDVLRGPERARDYRDLLTELAAAAGVTILGGARPWRSVDDRLVGVMVVPLPMPDVAQRRARWLTGSQAVGIPLADGEGGALASRFRLTLDQIDEAVVEAYNQARWRAASAGLEAVPRDQTVRDLFAAARAQSGHDLTALARKIEPVSTWDDIVLPDDSLAQLQELCARVAQGQRVFEEWGFGRKLSRGKGATALFTGPPGTGKTMAADIIAHEVGLDLYTIDLAGVVSKYIGETEKNLDRIFAAAEDANAILLFDEADALFGKRSEVRDSHDRYANIEISYLLQKMEQYEGLAILATNLRQNLDEAFVRRLAFTVLFPFPDEVSRRCIWAGIWPSETPLADDLDLAFLAHEFKLSGGNIKNVALAAAFLAAGEGGPVSMVHVRHAIRREYQKLGKVLTDVELDGASG